MVNMLDTSNNDGVFQPDELDKMFDLGPEDSSVTVFLNVKELGEGKLTGITEANAEQLTKESKQNILADKEYVPIQLKSGPPGEKGSYRAEPSISEQIHKIVELGGKLQIEDIDDQGNLTTSQLDLSRFNDNPFTPEEYERFYNATYTAFQDLANFYKELDERTEKQEAGNYNIDPRRVKLLAKEYRKTNESDSKNKDDKLREEKAKAQAAKQQEEDIADANAQKQNRYRREIQELELLFHVIHTTDRNRKEAENDSIKSKIRKAVPLNNRINGSITQIKS